MATTETRPRTQPTSRPALDLKKPSRGPVHWVRERLIQILGLSALFYMFLPIFVVFAFSFNAPTGRTNYTWEKFSLNAWLHPCDPAGMCESLGLSLKIGVVATILAAFLGTLIAFALARHRFRGRTATNLLIFMPMATPEVVMGSSLLTLFLNFTFLPLGPVTIVIAHVMFCVSYVVVTVKARIAGLDPRLEQAAMDLYASESTTFWKITFPLVLPGIVAGALLAFSLSFDDLIVTNFTSGGSVTFPMYVLGSSQRGTPVQVNVVGTAMFLIALAFVVGGQIIRRRRQAV